MILSKHFKHMNDAHNKYYRFEIWPFSVRDMFTDYKTYLWAFDDRLVDIRSDCNQMNFVLLGCYCSPFTHRFYHTPLALAEDFEELAIFADVQGLSPIEIHVNKN